MITTVNDLKNALNGGSKKNKFLVELSYSEADSRKLNLLCKTVNFPPKSISPVSAYYHGRKYNLRSEVDYGGSIDLTFIDDDELSIRQFFDKWMKRVDDSSKLKSGSFESSSGGTGLFDIIDTAKGIYDEVTDFVKDPMGTIIKPFKELGGSFLSGLTGSSVLADYQAYMKIWQLDGEGNKVYGYEVQNIFPTSIGEVTYDDSEMDSLVEFNVTFAFSEFDPCESSFTGGLIDKVKDFLG